MTDDISSREQLATLASDKARDIRDKAEEDAKSLGVDLTSAAGDPASEEAASEVESATSGALSSDDYLSSREAATTTTSSTFEKVLEDGKSRLMREAMNNVNAFTRQALVEADTLLDDIDTLLAEIQAEAAKTVLAASAGLLVPPSKDDVRQLRADTQEVRDRGQDTVEELASARMRRDAAKRHLETDDNVPPTYTAKGTKPVPQRFIEETPLTPKGTAPTDVGSSYVASSPQARALSTQAGLRGRSDERLDRATEALQGSVLDKVGYIAICLAIAGLDKKRANKERAERLFRRLLTVVEGIIASLQDNFVSNLQGLMQEAANEKIRGFVDSVQSKLDAFDTWLGLQLPELPTFVSVVKAIGDTASDQPVLESLAAHCDLNLTSFCEFQGLLEVAKSLDAELGKFLPRVPALGRTRLVVLAPETEKERPPEPQPDRDTAMFLVEVDGSDVVARLARSDVQPSYTTPTPPLDGTLTDDVDAGADTMAITLADDNVAAQGEITIGSEVLRYGSHEAGVFALVDSPDTNYLSGTPVQVTGEHRDTFVGAFEPSSNINGGPGSLVLDGDGETRERLTYSGSDFDKATGRYTFHLDSAPAHDHAFTVLCRPHAARDEILYKTSDLLSPAQRFRVQGNEIIPLSATPDPGGGYSRDPNFDFATGGTVVIDNASDYDDGFYRLRVGSDSYPVDLESASCVLSPPNSKLVLKSDFHGGDQDRVMLSRVEVLEETGNHILRLKLDSRQRHDLDVLDLAQGETKSMSGRMVLGVGDAISRKSGYTASIYGISEQQVATLNEPMVVGDETGMTVEVQGGTTVFSGTVTASSVSGNWIAYSAQALSGLVTINDGDPEYIYGDEDCRFKSEFQVGDWVHVPLPGGYSQVQSIIDNQTMQVSPPWPALTYENQPIYKVAQPGAKTTRLTVIRRPQEVVVFSEVRNLDDVIYEFTANEPLVFSHGLQEPEVKKTVKIVTDTVAGYLSHFGTAEDNVVPRSDQREVPVGSTTVRAELETPESQIIVGTFVENAGHITARGRDLATTNLPNSESDDVYTFELAAGLPFPLEDGEIIEVETMSVFDELQVRFPDDWADPYNALFAQLGQLLNQLDKKICQLLSGRPMDLAITAIAIGNAVTPIRAAILTLRLTLATLVLGLPESDVIEEVLDKFTESGMDQAAADVRAGDIQAVSQLTAATATREGKAREAVIDYRSEVLLFEDLKIADNLAASLTASEYDKEMLAAHNRDYKEIAREKAERKVEASQIILEDVETIT